MKKINPKLFIIVFNIFTAIILSLNQDGFIQIDEIWIRFLLFLLFIWNVLLFYFIVKNKSQ